MCTAAAAAVMTAQNSGRTKIDTKHTHTHTQSLLYFLLLLLYCSLFSYVRTCVDCQPILRFYLPFLFTSHRRRSFQSRFFLVGLVGCLSKSRLHIIMLNRRSPFSKMPHTHTQQNQYIFPSIQTIAISIFSAE